MFGFKLGRTHVPHKKNTAEMPPVRLTGVTEVILPMAQHIGAPATPVVEAGAHVYVGTLIGEATGYVSANIHSSVSGTVKRIDTYLQSNGRTCPAVVIESDGLMADDPSIEPPVVTDFDSFAAAIRASGAVGLGGAGFPLSVKLDAERRGLINTVVVNCAECEPYITSDTRTMLDETDTLVEAVGILKKYISAEEFIFGIENNKPQCIAKLTEAFADDPMVKIAALPSTYPQGGEKILVYNTTGRVIPEGKLPADVGCLVMNVTTLAFVAKYMRTGMPLVEKCITVDGSAILNPQNVIAPVGTPISDIIAFVGGFTSEPGKIIYGGPMMGVAIYTISDPVLKTTNAIVAFNETDSRPVKSTPCIHCGRCVSACPMGLNPTAFSKAMGLSDVATKAERLTDAKINLCIECGCCSFVCPAKRPLVENNRIAKSDLRQISASGLADKK